MARSYLRCLIDVPADERPLAIMEDPSLLDAALVEGANAQDEAAYHAKRADDALDLLRQKRDERREREARLVEEIKRLRTQGDARRGVIGSYRDLARSDEERVINLRRERDAAREEIAHLRQGIALALEAVTSGDVYYIALGRAEAALKDCAERDRNRAEGRQLDLGEGGPKFAVGERVRVTAEGWDIGAQTVAAIRHPIESEHVYRLGNSEATWWNESVLERVP